MTPKEKAIKFLEDIKEIKCVLTGSVNVDSPAFLRALDIAIYETRKQELEEVEKSLKYFDIIDEVISQEEWDKIKKEHLKGQ